jgi:guanylate cyclase
VSRLREAPHRLISFADEPFDNDDARLRKRVGVIAGYLTLVAPLGLVVQAQGHPLSWSLAFALTLFSIGNLLVLARSGRFDRYVVALIAAGTVFVPLATWVGGGITGASSGLVWAFLVPAYAIMALGPHRATPWFVAFLASVALMVLADPFVRDAIGTPPYPLQLIGQTQNAVVPLVITFLLLRYTDLGRRRAEARADELLTNALPASIAARMRRGETRIAEAYPDTTVVFADIVEFTRWTAHTEPMRAVALLDELFSAFDGAAASLGLEKIRTVGDSYMAVAGAPEPRADHAQAGLELARAILAAAADWRARNTLHLQLRAGLASGPVVAGVIGQRRMLFDLWGETVNLAARMESSSMPGRIQVAAGSWSLLRDRYRFVPREIEAKGIGPMTAYLLEQ